MYHDVARRVRGNRSTRLTPLAISVAASVAGLSACVVPSAAFAEAATLQVTGMTFVGSRAGVRELVLRSSQAWLRPDQRRAELSDVNATVTEPEGERSFTMTCARAELDIDTNDFLAEGDVRGETGDGQRYSASWVRYQHERGVLFTDAPVEMSDGSGSFRGDGFRYHVHERRFELLGNVRVEQRR